MKSMRSELEFGPSTTVEVFSRENTSFVHDIYISGPIEDAGNYLQPINVLRFASPNDTVRIFLNCPGGNLYTTMQILNAMRDSSATVITIGDGEVASAASLILLSGDQIEIQENCIMMIHNTSCEMGGKTNDITRSAIFNDKQARAMYKKIYSGFLTDDELNRVMEGQDYWFDSEEIEKRLVNFINYHNSLLVDEGECAEEIELSSDVTEVE